MIAVRINGARVEVAEGLTVAAVLSNAGVAAFRRSVTGEPRAPLCGMGICFECRVTVNGRAHVRGCVTLCEAEMEIATDG